MKKLILGLAGLTMDLIRLWLADPPVYPAEPEKEEEWVNPPEPIPEPDGWIIVHSEFAVNAWLRTEHNEALRNSRSFGEVRPFYFKPQTEGTNNV